MGRTFCPVEAGPFDVREGEIQGADLPRPFDHIPFREEEHLRQARPAQ